MKLLTCEYAGRRFAAVSDGVHVYEAAPDMLTLIDALGGKLPDETMFTSAVTYHHACSGCGVPRHELRGSQR